MDPIAPRLLLCLVTAHALGDFVLQSRADVEGKRRFGVLLKHVAIVTALSYGLAGLWTSWVLPLAVAVSHAAIDAIKARIPGAGVRAFFGDQAAHLVALGGIAWFCGREGTEPYWVDLAGEPFVAALLLLSGLVLTVYAGGYVIELATRTFLGAMHAASRERPDSVAVPNRGLAAGGMVIGRLERALIFFFVLTGHIEGVGFLIAAKSIFRFGELRDPRHRMEAEYIIIGTLMSFGYGLLVSYTTRVLLGWTWL